MMYLTRLSTAGVLIIRIYAPLPLIIKSFVLFLLTKCNCKINMKYKRERLKFYLYYP